MLLRLLYQFSIWPLGWAVYGHIGGGRWNALNGTSLLHLAAYENCPPPWFWLRSGDGSALMSRRAAERIAAYVEELDGEPAVARRFDLHQGGLEVNLGLPPLTTDT